jgi:hypothetical protein
MGRFFVTGVMMMSTVSANATMITDVDAGAGKRREPAPLGNA